MRCLCTLVAVCEMRGWRWDTSSLHHRMDLGYDAASQWTTDE